MHHENVLPLLISILNGIISLTTVLVACEIGQSFSSIGIYFQLRYDKCCQWSCRMHNNLPQSSALVALLAPEMFSNMSVNEFVIQNEWNELRKPIFYFRYFTVLRQLIDWILLEGIIWSKEVLENQDDFWYPHLKNGLQRIPSAMNIWKAMARVKTRASVIYVKKLIKFNKKIEEKQLKLWRLPWQY